MLSHDKSMLFTDVLLTSAVANVLATSPRILLPSTQAFYFKKGKQKTMKEGKIREANSLSPAKPIVVSDAFRLSMSANALTPSSPKLFPEQDKIEKGKHDDSQRLIEGI